MSRKPTLRQNGEYMFTRQVKFHIGFGGIIAGMMYELDQGGELPRSREAALKLAVRLRYECGAMHTPDFSEAAESRAQQCVERAKKLFPDL